MKVHICFCIFHLHSLKILLLYHPPLLDVCQVLKLTARHMSYLLKEVVFHLIEVLIKTNFVVSKKVKSSVDYKGNVLFSILLKNLIE